MAKNQTRNAGDIKADELIVEEKPVIGNSIGAQRTQGKIKFTRTKQVTLPVVKFLPNEPRIVRLQGAIYQGKKVEEKKEAAFLLHIVDMETGEEGLMIVGAVLKSTLEEGYPEASYVGKTLEIINHGIRGEKKYNTYSICEVTIED